MNQKYLIRLLSLFLFLSSSVFLQAQKVDTISVYSKKMETNVKNVLILPDKYDSKSLKMYPVVYLLHGYSGNYATWLTGVKKNLPELATKYQCIIVCPDGKNSWYFDSPINPESQYDSYVSDELVSYIDTHYKTISSAEGRAISGLSMGGHGALWLTIRHPNIFGAAGSMSGGVDFRPFPKNWEISKAIGNYQDNNDLWSSLTVIENIQKLKDKDIPLIVDCGQGDFFLVVNEKLHQKLLDLKIPHTYMTSPGEHNSKYWSNSIDYHMKFFSDFFRGNKTIN